MLGIPEWWPTGARIGVVLAHGAQSDMNDPLLQSVQKKLTDSGYLTIRFNFPFAEAKKKKPDEDAILEDAYSAALLRAGPAGPVQPRVALLDGQGRAKLQVTVPPLPALFAGETLFHAVVGFDPGVLLWSAPRFATWAVPLSFEL